MDEGRKAVFERMRAMQPAIDRAHYLATRDVLLEHARMGRSVSEMRDGVIVDVPPAEIFARYGLDECGRELTDPDPII